MYNQQAEHKNRLDLLLEKIEESASAHFINVLAKFFMFLTFYHLTGKRGSEVNVLN